MRKRKMRKGALLPYVCGVFIFMTLTSVMVNKLLFQNLSLSVKQRIETDAYFVSKSFADMTYSILNENPRMITDIMGGRTMTDTVHWNQDNPHTGDGCDVTITAKRGSGNWLYIEVISEVTDDRTGRVKEDYEQELRLKFQTTGTHRQKVYELF